MRQPRSLELPTPEALLLCPPRAPALFHRVLLLLLLLLERLHPRATYLVAVLSVTAHEQHQ